MATLGNAGRVGLVVLVSLALLGSLYVFFAGGLFRHTYSFDVVFDNARGIDKDSPVELAGVRIGTVEGVSLIGQKADLRLRVNDKINGREFRIPKGSRFTITSSLLSSTGSLTVIPPPDAARHPRGFIRDGESDLVGERTGDLSASLDKTNVLLDKAGTLLDKVTQLAGSPQLQRSLNQTTGNLSVASANGVKLTEQLNRLVAEDNDRLNRLLAEDNAQVQGLLRQVQSGAQVSIANLNDTTGQLRDTTRQNRDQINAIVVNLRDTTSSVAGLTAQASDLFKSGGLTQNLSASVANLKSASDKLNAIAGNFQSLSGDPTIQANLRATAQNIRDSSEQAKFLLERLNKLAGTKPRTASVVVTPGGGATVVVPPGGVKVPAVPTPAPTDIVPLFLPRVDLIQNTRASHFRADVDAIVPLGQARGAFARAGIYGVADRSRAILQGGQMVDRRGLFDYRYGLYASKLSLGGDVGLGRRLSLSFDAYDPNLVHLDARGVYMLNPGFGLLVGGEDITRRGGVIVGVELRH